MNNMQNADSGVPVKTAKNFSTTIPGAFTGKVDNCCRLQDCLWFSHKQFCLAV